jgi:hypothetical protein
MFGSAFTLCESSLKCRNAPDTVFAGYPANLKAGYRISVKGRIPDIRPDTLAGYPALPDIRQGNLVSGRISGASDPGKHIKSAKRLILLLTVHRLFA